MPQTILAVVAITIFSLFAISQQRRLIYAEQAMIRQTVGFIANGVATATLDEIAARPFDDATESGPITSASQLTLKSNFGVNGTVNPDIDDYSTYDVHPDSTLPVATRTVNTTSEEHTLTFQRKVEVFYAQESGGKWDTTSTRTKYKLIEVTVYSDQVDFADTVKVRQVVACRSNCQF